MVNVQERDNIIQLFLNLRRRVDAVKLPALDFTDELKSIEVKMLGALDSVEQAKQDIRDEIENQKNILINTPAEIPVKEKEKKGWRKWI